MNWHVDDSHLAIGLFVLSSLFVLYTYLLYPLALMALSRWRGGTRVDSPRLDRSDAPTEGEWPRVSVVVPLFNEETWVARKLDNTLSWDYPPGRLEVIAVSDGSTDRTNAILEDYHDRVRVLRYRRRQGKPTAMNRGMAVAQGEILLFTDANVMIEPKAIRRMVAHLQEQDVGAVSGNIEILSHVNEEPLGEGLYMRYERKLYELDSRVGTMVGLDGALFAARRRDLSPLPADSIVDDFAIAMQIISKGKRVAYDPRARGTEVVIPDVRSEYARKARMIAGGYQTLGRYRHLLNPLRFPVVAWQLLSHKLLRWTVPFWMTAAFLSSLTVASQHVSLALAVTLQACFYGLALAGAASRSLRRFMPVYAPYYFCAANVAAAVGLWRFLRGGQPVAWQKASRATEAAVSRAVIPMPSERYRLPRAS